MKERMTQAEIIKRLSNKELTIQLYISQGLIFLLAIISGFFFIENWFTLFSFDYIEIFKYGVIPAIIIVLIDFLLMYFLPEKYYDDGINERIFTNLSFIQIPIFVSIVAISEEMLFRGVIQTTFGYIAASLIFALVHFRYLFKPVLLVSILFVSFFIGYMFEITNNLTVTIIAHFLVDFILALVIKIRGVRKNDHIND
jgi:uncharacterized protein